jgi:subtilisin family serine protease
MKRWILTALVAATLVCASGGLASAQGAPPAGHPIILRSYTLDPGRGLLPVIPESLRIERYAEGASGDYLVQFKRGRADEGKAALARLGVSASVYLPEDAFKIRLSRAQVEKVRRFRPLEWIGPYQPAFKLAPKLAREGQAAYKVYLTESADAARVGKAIEALGGEVSGDGQVLTVVIDGNALDAIAHILDVEWIENFKVYKLRNDTAAGEMNASPAWNGGFTGAGVQIGLADTGLDTGVDDHGVNDDIHRDFDNRVNHISSWPIQSGWNLLVNNDGANDGASDLDSGHGTHTTGSAAGNGSRSGGTYKGIAPAAGITMQAIEQYVEMNALGEALVGPDGYYLAGIPDDLNTLFAEAQGWGTTIHSNSWGGGDPGAYDASSQDVDEYTWKHKNFLTIFAAGNDGVDANADGKIDPGSITSPSTAKNTLSVGATENRKPAPAPNADSGRYGTWWPSDYSAEPIKSDFIADAGGDGLAAFSSRGPTLDGRIKPDVVAPGTWIASVRSSLATYDGWGDPIDAFYMYMGGTSMSTPLVAGAVTLVKDYYVNTWKINPSAALLKATIINSATDVSGQYAAPYLEAGPIPNSNEGWGLVNLDRAIVDHERKVSDSKFPLRTGDKAQFTATVESSARPGRVTLVWSDYPASPAAGKTLVNDLDLVVESPSGLKYMGNRFSNGWTVPGLDAAQADRTNNVECVYIQTPEPGVWKAYVEGVNVPSGPQVFAIVGDADFAPRTTAFFDGKLISGPRRP